MQAYAMNAAVSASLYPSLQNLEIALRNAFNERLSRRYGEWWFDELGVISEIFQRRKVAEAKIDLVRDHKALKSGGVVAALSFGFWTTCLSARYEDTLWRKGGLATAFMASGEKPKRNVVNRALTQIRLLRNRIAHHEPVLRFDLEKRRDEVLLVTRWLSPVMADWSQLHCRFEENYDRELAATFWNHAENSK